MSISVDHAQYYQPAYFNRAQAVSEAPPALPGADDQSAPPSGETLPPVQSGLSSQRLSGEDMRLLVLRDVGEDGIAAYEGILDQFFSDPANYDDPVAFLQNLSADGIDLLRQAQSLPAGANIDVNGLNREEALNFILPSISYIVAPELTGQTLDQVNRLLEHIGGANYRIGTGQLQMAMKQLRKGFGQRKADYRKNV